MANLDRYLKQWSATAIKTTKTRVLSLCESNQNVTFMFSKVASNLRHETVAIINKDLRINEATTVSGVNC